MSVANIISPVKKWKNVEESWCLEKNMSFYLDDTFFNILHPRPTPQRCFSRPGILHWSIRSSLEICRSWVLEVEAKGWFSLSKQTEAKQKRKAIEIENQKIIHKPTN